MKSSDSLGKSSAESAGAHRSLRLGQRHAPLREIVKEEIRRTIVQGTLKPGDRLVEDRLAADFGVSRLPVREALRELAAEGLVEVTARKGAVVTEMTPTLAQELIEVRAILEAYNARLAARRRNPEMLTRLQEIMRAGDQAMAEGRVDMLRPLNDGFHDALAAAGSNRVLEDVMRSLRERSSVVFVQPTLATAPGTWAEHADILKAVINGDEALAALMAERHVLSAGRLFLTALDGKGEAG
jgi:DNA-binding GntR family transcriptional regulator